ncbi:hypothetical protein [Kocuria sp. KH4]
MSKYTAATAEAELSPKVKSAAVWSAVIVVVGGALASAIAAIPDSAWESLGVWAGPVGVFVGGLGVGLGAVVAGYQKRDPLREVGGSAVAAGGVVPAFPTTGVGAGEAVGEEAQPVADDAHVEALTPEADALAARAAQLRRTGSTAGSVS